MFVVKVCSCLQVCRLYIYIYIYDTFFTLCLAQSCICFVDKGGGLSDRAALITNKTVSIPSAFFLYTVATNQRMIRGTCDSACRTYT